jgi:GINS complex subunit 1
MYGDQGTKLVLSAKRAKNLDRIPLFEHDLVQSIINESNELQKQIDGVNTDPILTNQTDVTDLSNITGINSSRMASNTNTPLRSVHSNFFSSSVNNTPRTAGSSKHSPEDQELLDSMPEFVRQMFLARNKRCLLAYEMARVQSVGELVWDNVELSSEQLADLSHNERTYLEKYTSLVSGMKGLMPDVDLGGDLEPPSDVFIDVRVLQDAGEIMTEYGVFNLTKDSQFFVRKADVERLIQQGYLKQL